MDLPRRACLSVAQEERIPVQRCLLDGGTCEATAYQLYGYTCAAASLALGNYHNITPEGTIAMEYVAIDDFVGMVRLCVATVLRRGRGSDPQKVLLKKLEKNAATYRRFYRPSWYSLGNPMPTSESLAGHLIAAVTEPVRKTPPTRHRSFRWHPAQSQCSQRRCRSTARSRQSPIPCHPSAARRWR